NGAVVELETCTPLGLDGRVQLLLTTPSFETSRRIAAAINTNFPESALALDAASVEVIVPFALQSTVSDFVARLGNLTVLPDVVARVVINERTGTVVVGEHVRLSRVLITHANLAVSTVESPN